MHLHNRHCIVRISNLRTKKRNFSNELKGWAFTRSDTSYFSGNSPSRKVTVLNDLRRLNSRTTAIVQKVNHSWFYCHSGGRACLKQAGVRVSSIPLKNTTQKTADEAVFFCLWKELISWIHGKKILHKHYILLIVRAIHNFWILNKFHINNCCLGHRKALKDTNLRA